MRIYTIFLWFICTDLVNKSLHTGASWIAMTSSYCLAKGNVTRALIKKLKSHYHRQRFSDAINLTHTYLWHHSAPILCYTHTKYRSKPVRPSYDRCLHGVELSWRRRFHSSALGPAFYAPNSSKDFSPLGQNTCFKLTSEEFNMHHPGNNHRHFQEKLCHLCSASAISNLNLDIKWGIPVPLSPIIQ